MLLSTLIVYAGIASIGAAALAGLIQWLDRRRVLRIKRTLKAGLASGQTFGPGLVATLPKAVQRYFAFSIADGTELRTRVALKMSGAFVLGTRQKQRRFSMQARETLAPPSGFVWEPVLRAGPAWITGSDGLLRGEAWTRFWLLSLLPVARVASSPDLTRAAISRLLLEAIWAPASLLPADGARWTEIDAEHVRVSRLVGGEPFTMDMQLGADGRPMQVSTRRWTNANPEGEFRWQPFGAQIMDFRTFEGFTIPAAVEVGNQFGTPDYFPFFLARIDDAGFF